jgi:hypothetical protein
MKPPRTLTLTQPLLQPVVNHLSAEYRRASGITVCLKSTAIIRPDTGERAIEYWPVPFAEVACSFDGPVLIDVRDYRVNRRLIVAETRKRARHSLIDQRHVAATYQLLPRHQSQHWFNAGGAQSIMKPIVPVGARTVTWELR